MNLDLFRAKWVNAFVASENESINYLIPFPRPSSLGKHIPKLWFSVVKPTEPDRNMVFGTLIRVGEHGKEKKKRIAVYGRRRRRRQRRRKSYYYVIDRIKRDGKASGTEPRGTGWWNSFLCVHHAMASFRSSMYTTSVATFFFLSHFSSATPMDASATWRVKAQLIIKVVFVLLFFSCYIVSTLNLMRHDDNVDVLINRVWAFSSSDENPSTTQPREKRDNLVLRILRWKTIPTGMRNLSRRLISISKQIRRRENVAGFGRPPSISTGGKEKTDQQMC